MRARDQFWNAQGERIQIDKEHAGRQLHFTCRYLVMAKNLNWNRAGFIMVSRIAGDFWKVLKRQKPTSKMMKEIASHPTISRLQLIERPVDESDDGEDVIEGCRVTHIRGDQGQCWFRDGSLPMQLNPEDQFIELQSTRCPLITYVAVKSRDWHGPTGMP